MRSIQSWRNALYVQTDELAFDIYWKLHGKLRNKRQGIHIRWFLVVLKNTALCSTSYWQLNECDIAIFESIRLYGHFLIEEHHFLPSGHVIKPRVNELAVGHYIATYWIIYLLKRQPVVIQLSEAMIHDYTRGLPSNKSYLVKPWSISISLMILWYLYSDSLVMIGLQ